MTSFVDAKFNRVLLTGVPTIDTHAATKKYVDDQVKGLVDGADINLDTLKEIGQYVKSGSVLGQITTLVSNGAADAANISANSALLSTQGATLAAHTSTLSTHGSTLSTHGSTLAVQAADIATRQLREMVTAGSGKWQLQVDGEGLNFVYSNAFETRVASLFGNLPYTPAAVVQPTYDAAVGAPLANIPAAVRGTVPDEGVPQQGRPGWSFSNSVGSVGKVTASTFGAPVSTTGKVNWYFFSAGAENLTAGSLTSYYMRLRLNVATSTPFLVMYTKTTGAGDKAGWYGSKDTMTLLSAPVTAGQEVILYVGANPKTVEALNMGSSTVPAIHLALTDVMSLASMSDQSAGGAARFVNLISLQTDSGAAGGNVDFSLFEAGYAFSSGTVKRISFT